MTDKQSFSCLKVWPRPLYTLDLISRFIETGKEEGRKPILSSKTEGGLPLLAHESWSEHSLYRRKNAEQSCEQRDVTGIGTTHTDKSVIRRAILSL